jgi:hypothetical protein
MAGLDPAIYRGTAAGTDARVKPARDKEEKPEQSIRKAVGITAG